MDTKLSKIMKNKNINVIQLAEITGISSKTLQLYMTREKDINKLSLEDGVKIARALRIDPFYLLEYDENNYIKLNANVLDYIEDQININNKMIKEHEKIIEQIKEEMYIYDSYTIAQRLRGENKAWQSILHILKYDSTK